MNHCEWLSDRMPAVALGRAEWTTDEISHLTGCRSCQQEWDLVQLTSRLGEGVELRLDEASTSRVILQRVEQAREDRLRRRTWSFVGLAAAATLAAVVWTERPMTRPPAHPPEPVVARLQIPLPELDSLQPAELDSVLQTMDAPLGDSSTLDAPDLGDLDSQELQSVLDFWEG